MYNEKDIAAIKEYMVRHKQTLAVAESVTSGHLQAAISLANGATDFFQGGITVYNLGQKAKHLNVDPISALACNCISEKTTDEMALNALRLFACDWTIAITGYAAPVPELGVSNLFAYFSIAYNGDIVKNERINGTNGNPLSVQLHYTTSVLAKLHHHLVSLKK
jgi:PncC family amidohydrolase